MSRLYKWLRGEQFEPKPEPQIVYVQSQPADRISETWLIVFYLVGICVGLWIAKLWRRVE